MAKIKTHKATAKRFSITKTGKVKMNSSNRRHKLGIKDQKRKRHLRTASYVQGAMATNMRNLIQK